MICASLTSFGGKSSWKLRSVRRSEAFVGTQSAKYEEPATITTCNTHHESRQFIATFSRRLVTAKGSDRLRIYDKLPRWVTPHKFPSPETQREKISSRLVAPKKSTARLLPFYQWLTLQKYITYHIGDSTDLHKHVNWVVVSKIFHPLPGLEKWSNLTNIFWPFTEGELVAARIEIRCWEVNKKWLIFFKWVETTN